jgi:hypothetical protein
MAPRDDQARVASRRRSYTDHAPEDRADRDSYYDSSRPDHRGSKQYYSRGDDFPECFGSCFAGRCKLEQERPGCCYPATFGSYVAASQQSAVDSDATVSGGVAKAEGYRQNGDGRDLVCWRGEDDLPEIVQQRT